jgi:hypothetical protein
MTPQSDRSRVRRPGGVRHSPATLELEADVTILGVFTDDGTFLPNGHTVR